MRKMTTKKAARILEQVAKQNDTTVENVRAEIEEAIRVGMNSTDPNALEMWKAMPHSGDVPTPEEVIVYLTDQMKSMPLES